MKFQAAPIGHSRIKNGYRYVKVAEGKWDYEQRVVMEGRMGRKLDRDEVVHHIDRDRLNNNPMNLMVMSREEHSELHYGQGDAINW